jgi:hypothetical protein
MEELRQFAAVTDQERAARHFNVDVSAVTDQMIEQLPPRGTGLLEKDAVAVKENDIDVVAMFLLVHSMAHMETGASPGIVVNPDVAARTPCRCARVNGSELCFSEGIIGTMDEAQKEAYCNPKVYFESPGLEKRLGEFKEAVAAAQEKIKDVPRGERLQPWLSSMSEELGKRGIEV